MTSSAEVTWQLDGIDMRGTLVRPDGHGSFPAVVLVAGSGPTDRDWCSPLLPGTNGSARLLAEAFADSGIASLRFDKRASGPHARENVSMLMGKMSMKSHLDELVAAVGVLASVDLLVTSCCHSSHCRPPSFLAATNSCPLCEQLRNAMRPDSRWTWIHDCPRA
jgi:hypothetical protein